MRRKSDPSSCRERLYVLIQGLSDFNPVVPMISQKGQNRQFSAVFQAPNPAGKAILSEECQGQNQKRKSCARWSVLLGLIAASLPLPRHGANPGGH